jgi:CRISPR system Cascade subunit CasD
LFDAVFTVAVGAKPQASITLDRIESYLRMPCYTPVLGRRSCPIARPLLDADGFVEAGDAKAALSLARPTGGLIYTEGELESAQPMQMRDVPLHGKHRQFGTRRIYVHREDSCS